MSASHSSAIANNRETVSARERLVFRSNDSALNPTRDGESQAAANPRSDHVDITHGQDKPPISEGVPNISTNVAEKVNAAGAASASDVHQTGHKRRKALASVAALVVGLTSLGLRIAQMVGDMN